MSLIAKTNRVFSCKGFFFIEAPYGLVYIVGILLRGLGLNLYIYIKKTSFEIRFRNLNAVI